MHIFNALLSRESHARPSIAARQSQRQAYYDSDGDLVECDWSIPCDGPAEFAYVTSHDSGLSASGEQCYIMNSSWLDEWAGFATGTSLFSVFFLQQSNFITLCTGKKPAPGLINNSILLDDTLMHLSPHVEVKSDFRVVKRDVWVYLFCRYGGGPVLVFPVPEGCSPKEYKKGTWIKHALPTLVERTRVIHPSANPRKEAPETSFAPVKVKSPTLEADAAAIELQKEVEGLQSSLKDSKAALLMSGMMFVTVGKRADDAITQLRRQMQAAVLQKTNGEVHCRIGRRQLLCARTQMARGIGLAEANMVSSIIVMSYYAQ